MANNSHETWRLKPKQQGFAVVLHHASVHRKTKPTSNLSELDLLLPMALLFLPIPGICPNPNAQCLLLFVQDAPMAVETRMESWSPHIYGWWNPSYDPGTNIIQSQSVHWDEQQNMLRYYDHSIYIYIYIRLDSIVLHCVTFYYIVIILYHILLYQIISYHIILYHIILYAIIFYRIIYHIILYHIIWYDIELYYIILYYII